MWLTKISKEESQLIVFGLVGTKLDVGDDFRKTSREKAEAFCIQHSIDVYFEISAKDNFMVEELFQELVDSMVARFDIV